MSAEEPAPEGEPQQEAAEDASPPAPEDSPDTPLVTPTDTPPAHGDKKVTVNQSPDVFNIMPDSTEVQAVPRPPPPPSEPPPDPLQTSVLPQHELDKIIKETLEIVEHGQKQANEQKLLNQKMAFMLSQILESLKMYETYINKLNSFLVNNNILQSEWYYRYCQQLPTYGDYNVILKDRPDKIEVDEVKGPVSESALKGLTEEVVNNFYAGGAHIKTQRIMCNDINSKIVSRRKLLCEITGPFASWFFIMNKQAEAQDKIKEKLFNISAYIGFLKTGESQEPLKLDVSQSMCEQ